MKKGFTLIELLVAVSIFSGLVILAIGAFARSAISSERTNHLRDKTSAARTVVDQIGNDFRFVEDEKFVISGSKLTLTLKYPDLTYVKKVYEYTNETVVYAEQRCGTTAVNCADPTQYSTLLDSGYKVVPPTVNLPIFSGEQSTSTTRGYLTVNLSIKPADADSGLTDVSLCDSYPGVCYQLKTTYAVGSYL